MPVQVLGLTSVPGAGDNFLVVDDDRMARQIADKREARSAPRCWPSTTRRKTLDQLFEQLEKGETQELKLILKGDGRFGRGAGGCSLAKIEVGDEVSLRVIDRGVGAITETNVSLAAASDAVIIGFNVRPPRARPRRWPIRGRRHPVLLGHLRGDRRDRGRAQGHAQADLRGEDDGPGRDPRDLPSSKFGNIAGCMVTDGTSGATPRRACSATASSSPRPRSRRCGARRTTSPRSARASSAV
jgi:translation initiation factor IF-2